MLIKFLYNLKANIANSTQTNEQIKATPEVLRDSSHSLWWRRYCSCARNQPFWRITKGHTWQYWRILQLSLVFLGCLWGERVVPAHPAVAQIYSWLCLGAGHWTQVGCVEGKCLYPWRSLQALNSALHNARQVFTMELSPVPKKVLIEILRCY